MELNERTVCLVIVGDGREEYLLRAVKSARDNLQGRIIARVMVNDSGDAEYGRRLVERYPEFQVVNHVERLGMAAAVQNAWTVGRATGAEFLFHLEEDFVFNREVNLNGLTNLLAQEPTLCQAVLVRQPWSDEERASPYGVRGGPYATNSVLREGWGYTWLEHDNIFSLNPCLIPRHIAVGWPPDNEAGFTLSMKAAGYRMAWLGGVDDPPAVEHIGHNRGTGWKL